MAPTFRSAGTAVLSESSGGTNVITYAATAGDCLFVGVGLNGAANPIVSVVSDLDGALSLVRVAGSSNVRAELWYLNNCSGGTHTITVTNSNAAGRLTMCQGFGYSGVSAVATAGATAAFSGTGSTSPSVGPTTSDTGDTVLCWGYSTGDPVSITPSGTAALRWSQGPVPSFNDWTYGIDDAGAASVTIAATFGVSMTYAWVGVNLEAAAGGLTIPIAQNYYRQMARA